MSSDTPPSDERVQAPDSSLLLEVGALLLVEFEYEWREGSRDRAKEIAKQYIKENRARLEPILSRLTRDELVVEIDKLRSDGRHSDRLVVDMWLMAEYEPQNIAGKIQVVVQRPFGLAAVHQEVPNGTL